VEFLSGVEAPLEVFAGDFDGIFRGLHGWPV